MRPIKKLMIILILTIMIVSLTTSIGTILYLKDRSKDPVVLDEVTLAIQHEEVEDMISIANIEATEGVIFIGDTFTASVSIENKGADETRVWLGASLQDSVGKWYDIDPKSISVPTDQVVTEPMEWLVPEDVLTGDYTIVIALWDAKPDDSANRLESITLTEALRIYHSKESFEVELGEQWLANDSELGRSILQSKNVTIEDGKLNLKLPRASLYGAEIQSKEKVHYGSYEIRMRIPDAPSSITGFFLYEQPDYEHEIDIEIYNQADEAILILTTYADGKQANTITQILPFDPTADFHNYRFNYYPDRVDFFIDDIMYQTWYNGFTAESMYLMLNAWYPTWLDGTLQETDRYLVVDWILK